MHEFSIAESIIKIVVDQLQSQGVKAPVQKIVVRAGKMKAIIPDSLQFHFSVARKNSPQTAEAILELEQLPVVVHCPNCNVETQLDAPVFACEKCGGFVSVRSGNELQVVSVEVED